MPFYSEVVGGALVLGEWRHQTPSGFWASVRLGPFGIARSAPDNIGVADDAVFLGVAWRLILCGSRRRRRLRAPRGAHPQDTRSRADLHA